MSTERGSDMSSIPIPQDDFFLFVWVSYALLEWTRENNLKSMPKKYVGSLFF
jgi:hypothetical protein